MMQERWKAVDDYFDALFIEKDPVLEAALADSDAAELACYQCGCESG